MNKEISVYKIDANQDGSLQELVSQAKVSVYIHKVRLMTHNPITNI